MGNQIRIVDEETQQLIVIDDPNFYGPAIPAQDSAYSDSSCVVQIGNTAANSVTFNYPQKPTEDYELAMWSTLDTFETGAWQAKNVGVKTGFDSIDKGFEGGLFPGFIIIGGDSNLGKSAFITQLAWGIVENVLGPMVIPLYLLFGF
jgi:replicative DNA helicase